MAQHEPFLPTDIEEAVAFAQYRAQTYAAASEAFTVEPDAPKLRALVAAADQASAQNTFWACEEDLYGYLRALSSSDPAELRTRVATEYAELFVGPRAPLAPLYESVYVGAIRRLNTDVTMRVRRFYEREGLEVVRRNTVPNDHIGLELEFMAALCTREADALEAGDADEAQRLQGVQRDFLQTHLGAWVDAFAARVAQAYCAHYYDAWTRFVQAFVSEDSAYLARVS